MKKIAIMGGTFDPVHMGHLIAAQSVYDTGFFDQVWFMPSGNPPHKTVELTDSEHRFKMCQLAVEGIDHFCVSDFELHREGTIYTVDTFSLLSEAYQDREFYLIIGSDSVHSLHKWYDFERLMKLGNFVAVGRGGYDKVGVDELIDNYYNLYGTRFIQVAMPQVEISSTEIRDRQLKGQTIRYRTPDSVVRYIEGHGLYR